MYLLRLPLMRKDKIRLKKSICKNVVMILISKGLFTRRKPRTKGKSLTLQKVEPPLILNPKKREPKNHTEKNISYMKLRITPLNFVSAFFLIIAVYSWVFGMKISGMQFKHMGATIGWI